MECQIPPQNRHAIVIFCVGHKCLLNSSPSLLSPIPCLYVKDAEIKLKLSQ